MIKKLSVEKTKKQGFLFKKQNFISPQATRHPLDSITSLKFSNTRSHSNCINYKNQILTNCIRN